MAGSDDLRRLESDLGKIPGKVVPELERAMKRGAQNVKVAMEDAFRSSESFTSKSGRPPRISYDRKGFVGTVGYEVGPTVGGAGSLAAIAVEGGANGGGGTVDIDKPVQAEVDKLEKYIDVVIRKLL